MNKLYQKNQKQTVQIKNQSEANCTNQSKPNTIKTKAKTKATQTQSKQIKNKQIKTNFFGGTHNTQQTCLRRRPPKKNC